MASVVTCLLVLLSHITYNLHVCTGCCHSLQRSSVYRCRQGTGEWLRWLRASLCCCLILLITDMSVQVVATPYNDHLCIAVAKELENGFGCCHSVQRSPVYRRCPGTGECLRWLRASLCCCLILLITDMSEQVVATPYNDHLCIAVAQELENAFGGYVPPCAVVS
ncbi:hypothetical protein J6590_036843 [Homalodisca vitripennis]|nr:hypothetical protein J6590_036843 [Homalodisca vitripennis]